MVTLHRNKAYLGLGCWVASVAVLVLLIAWQQKASQQSHLSSELFAILVIATLFTQFFLYLWGALQLAKAKGQPEVLALFGLLCFIGQLAGVGALLALPDKHPKGSPANLQGRRKRRQASGIGFVIRCRRNAIVGISFGLCGIATGLSLVIWPGGSHNDPENIRVAGMFVFLISYVSVIIGCWWWLKAKAWNDAIIFIGLMPLGILFVPYVRLIVLSIPALLPLGMVFMPLVLIVVVLALPDRSGFPKGSGRRNRAEPFISDKTRW